MLARDNPFAAESTDALEYRPQGITWDQLCRRLESLRYRAAIVGPEGTGKTTLLLRLSRWFASRGTPTHWLRVEYRQRRLTGDQRRRFEWLSADDVLLVEGAEQLSWLTWRGLLRRARPLAGLVATCHFPGRLPTLLHCTTSPELLDELVNQLAPADAPALRPIARQLFDHYQGNLRQCLRALYDLAADRARHSPASDE